MLRQGDTMSFWKTGYRIILFECCYRIYALSKKKGENCLNFFFSLFTHNITNLKFSLILNYSYIINLSSYFKE